MALTRYYLYLDESGSFRERGAAPSVVAGWIRRGRPMDEQEAKDLAHRVRRSSRDYGAIPLPFHGIEAARQGVAGVGGYAAALLSALTAADDVRLVHFVNQKHISIVDEPTTYLHVFCDGILALVSDLLEQTDGAFELHILAAQRQDDELRALKREGRIAAEEKIAIPHHAYRVRIDERLQTLIARLSSADQRRFRAYTFETGLGDRDWRLTLADAACFALRGGRENMTERECAHVDQLPCLRYEVPEKGAWEAIRDAFRHGRQAEAVSLWYGTYDGVLGDAYRTAFERAIGTYFARGGEQELAITCAILSETVRKLVQRRLFREADAFLAKLQDELYPLLAPRLTGRKQRLLDRVQFDGHFYRLTIATHEGDIAAAEREIAACDALLPRLPKTFESLDYDIRYQIRVIEHRKNTYDFAAARDALGRLATSMEELLDVVAMVDGFEDLGKGMISENLGRIKNSRAATLSLLAVEHPDDETLLAQAEDDARAALAHFAGDADRARVYEQLAEAQALRGAYADACASLAAAFGAEEGTPAAVLAALLQDGDGGAKAFGLLHYATIMSRALAAEDANGAGGNGKRAAGDADGGDAKTADAVGAAMMAAWDAAAAEIAPLLQDDAYPNDITLWRLASACARTGKKSRRDYAAACYRTAIAACRRIPDGKDAPAAVEDAAALPMELERAVLLPQQQDAHLEELLGHLAAFLARTDLPPALRACFADWPAILAPLAKADLAAKRDNLLALAARVPVL